MKTLTTLLFVTLLGATHIQAQSQGTLDKAAMDSRSCLMMSDSMSTAIGLSEEQAKLVRKSDERCLQACEKMGYRTTGALDEAAVREHAAEMKEILTSQQYASWGSMCIAGMQENGEVTPIEP